MTSDAIPVSGGLDRRRWLILGAIGLAQLMVVLDVTMMNIALPSAQRELHFTTADRQWVVTAYALAFGSLLLPGGRLADFLGRKVTFLTGLALTGLALAHGYDTAFWWTAGIFAGGAVIGGILLRPGPLDQQGTPAQAHDEVPAAQAKAGPAARHDPGVPVARITSIR
jgi:MFS family permease